MIAAHELRIGNWVRFGEQCEGVITEIMASGCTYDCEHRICGHEDWSCISPIPLSPEVLKACGFKNENKANQYIEYENDYFIIAKHGLELRIYLGYDVEAYIEVELPHIKSLHQLQNLYYSLTQTELIYQPYL